LARADEYCVSLEGLCVGGINFNNCQIMPGNLEEELIIQRCIDDA
jgi:hypothetical protein